MRIQVSGMQGLGDNIYIRAFVKTLVDQGHDLTVVTPWPDLFKDLPRVKFQRPHSRLRTQVKNMQRVRADRWNTETVFDKRFNVAYAAASNISNDFTRQFRCLPTWGLPRFKGPSVDKPYIVVRPATLRKEWFASSRNPKPEYIASVVGWLSDRFNIVSVADLQTGEEWAEGELPFADIRYHKGELSMSQMLGLCQNAAGVVGGVGWIVPFAVSCNVPTFVVCGGAGGYNAPEKLVNGTVDSSNIVFAVPDNYCECTDMTHDCDKTITDLRGFFDDWQRLL